MAASSPGMSIKNTSLCSMKISGLPVGPGIMHKKVMGCRLDRMTV